MATTYPGALDAAPTTHQDAQDAYLAIEGELGVNPSGGNDTVARRLNRVSHGIGGGFLPDYVTGRYYDGSLNGTDGASLAPSAGSILFAPFFCVQTRTFDRIGVAVVTTLTSGTGIRLGVYSADDTGYPDALVVDGGAVGITAGGQEAVISTALDADRLYWLALLTDGAGGAIRTRGKGASPAFGLSAITSDNNAFARLSLPQAYGALPASVAGGAFAFANTAAFSVRLRAA